MTSLTNWWKKNKNLSLAIIGIAISVGVVALIFAAYLFKWTGAGFYNKTFWDWMQLLIVPVVLAVGAFLFNLATSRNEQTIALDSQRESLLQAYLDRMSELLLEKHLMDEGSNNKAKDIARARTLTVLSRLDPVRKGNLVLFLQEAGLIKRQKGIREDDRTIILLKHADLREAYLVEAILLSTDLSQTNLIKANLSRAYMYSIDLSGAKMSGADLTEAFITYADLRGANLADANLSGSNLCRSNLGMVELDEKPTNLTRANLTKADLTGANLENAILKEANLAGANLTEAHMKNTNLAGANLNGAMITKQQLEEAKVS